ncbi:hypothetical protein Tco_1435346, partial [Tanacetum coccineum]
GSFDEFNEIEACQLIVEWFRIEQIVAKGQVYPSRDGILHGLPIEPGYVKIDEPMPSQALLIGHGHHQMVVLD